MKKLLFFLMIGLISLASSCKKEIDTENFGSIPIELRLRVLDSNNRGTTEIKAGENFWLSFLLINRSKKESEYWQLSNGNNFGDTDFFRVYRIEADNSKVDMGTPLKSLLCQSLPMFRTMAKHHRYSHLATFGYS